MRIRELRADEKYQHVTLFLRAFLIQNPHRAKVFLWKQSMLFLGDMVGVYRTAAAVNVTNRSTGLVAVSDKELQHNNGLPALSCFAQRHTNFMK